MKQSLFLFVLLVFCNMLANARGGCEPALLIKNPMAKHYPIEFFVDTFRIELNPLDSTLVFRIDEYIGSCDYSGIHWFKNNNPIQGDIACTTAGTGIYRATFFSSKGEYYNTTIVVTSVTTGVDEPTSNPAFDFRLAPNPSVTGLFTIERETLLQPCVITVYNLSGQVIKTLQMDDKYGVVDISVFGKGLYVLELTFADGLRKRQKIIFD